MLAGSGSGFAALTLSTLSPKLINWVHLIKNDSLKQHPCPQCTAAGVARAQKPTLMGTRTKTHASVQKHTKTHACRHVYTRACWSKTGPVLASRPREKGYKHTRVHRRTPAQTRDCWSRTRACSCLACACFRRASIAASCACILAISRPSL